MDKLLNYLIYPAHLSLEMGDKKPEYHIRIRTLKDEILTNSQTMDKVETMARAVLIDMSYARAFEDTIPPCAPFTRHCQLYRDLRKWLRDLPIPLSILPKNKRTLPQQLYLKASYLTELFNLQALANQFSEAQAEATHQALVTLMGFPIATTYHKLGTSADKAADKSAGAEAPEAPEAPEKSEGLVTEPSAEQAPAQNAEVEVKDHHHGKVKGKRTASKLGKAGKLALTASPKSVDHLLANIQSQALKNEPDVVAACEHLLELRQRREELLLKKASLKSRLPLQDEIAVLLPLNTALQVVLCNVILEHNVKLRALADDMLISKDKLEELLNIYNGEAPIKHLLALFNRLGISPNCYF